jgi:hypothetical protein
LSLFFIFIVTLWIRSQYVTDVFFAQRSYHQVGGYQNELWRLSWESGEMLLSYGLEDRPQLDGFDRGLAQSLPERKDAHWATSYGRWSANRHRYDGVGRASIFGSFANSVGFAYVLAAMPDHGFDLMLPFWFLAVTALIPAALAVRSVRNRLKFNRLTLAGRCPRCSYDLRAHAADAKCPECGTPVSKLT